jgi:hypothetical protein
MSKGVNALEIVFAMFILIVVTLVVIRLFTGIVKQDTLPNLDDFRQAYRYSQEKSKCSNLCSDYTIGGCNDLAAAYSFCEHTISIDIDGNNVPGEKGHYGVVTSIPYCEDGLYCFHIQDCGCGNYILGPEACLQTMRDYLTKTVPKETAEKLICNKIKYGTCKTDPNDWERKVPGFQSVELPDGTVLGTDYWWVHAGYAKICETE